MKKTVLLLLMVFAVNIYPAAAFANNLTDTQISYSEQSSDVLPELGLLNILAITDNVTYNTGERMTRENFAVCAAKMLNLTVSDQNVRYFSDVEQSGYAAGAINALVELNIISASPDARFRPAEYITAAEAIKMMICVLGYSEYAEHKGGFPSGYNDLASELDLTDNVNIQGEFTQKDAYTVMYNALHTNLYLSTGINKHGDTVYSKDSETLLGKYYDVHMEEGTVTAVHGQNMNTFGMPDEYSICIDGTMHRKDERLDADGFFGGFCKVWFKGDPKKGGSSVIYLAESDDAAKKIEIQSDLYEDYAENKLSYYISGTSDKVKSTRLKAVNFIYNGTPLLDGYKAAIENINKGTITVKDSDGDNIYDLVIIEDYRNFVVGSVNNNIFYNKADLNDTISLGKYDAVRIYRGSLGKTDYSEIAAGDVLSVAESADKTAVKIMVSSAEITAKAESVSNDSGKLTVTIEGRNYNFDDSYQRIFVLADGSLKYDLIKDKYFYKLDYMNNICWIDTDSSGMKLGYIIDVWKSESSRDLICAKIFTTSNSCEQYECAPKMKIDGVRKNKYDEVISAFPNSENGFAAQLIRYALNEKKQITAIDTSNFVAGSEQKENSMIARYERPKKTWYNSRRLGVAAYMDANTPVFYVPAGASNPEEEDVFCGSYSFMMSNDESYTCNSYRFGSLDMSTGAVVCEYDFSQLPKNRNRNAKVLMFDSVRMTINSEGDNVQLVKCYSDGVKTEVQVPLSISLNNLQRGDIVRFYYDINGNVADNFKTGLPDFEIICRRSDIYEKNSPCWTNNSTYPNLYSEQTNAELNYYRAGIQLSYGFVNCVDGTLVGWGYTDGSSVDETANIPGNIVIYDSSERDEYRIRTGTVSDITDYLSAGEACSKIIYHTGNGAYLETFIYR